MTDKKLSPLDQANAKIKTLKHDLSATQSRLQTLLIEKNNIEKDRNHYRNFCVDVFQKNLKLTVEGSYYSPKVMTGWISTLFASALPFNFDWKKDS